MRRVARLMSWPPTVAPICASSPAAWMVVVTISGPLGAVPRRPGGGVGRLLAAGSGAAFTVAAAGFDLAFLDEGFDFAFLADGFDFAFFGEGFGVVAVAVAVDELVAEARRSPPSRVGRVERRAPSTPGSAAALVAFLVFFFEDLSLMASAAEREFPDFASRRDTVIGEAGAPRFDFKKYSA